MSRSRQLYDIFFEGCTHYSIAKTNRNGGLAYYTEEGIPTLELIEQHLAGETVLGAYNLLPNNTVRWMAFDVDSKADYAKAREIAKKLCEFLDGIDYIVEWSGNKGYHIIIFFDKPVPAAEAKAVGDAIREACGLPKSGDPHVEVYPKQEKLTPSNPHGNLLRLPLGQHPTTHNKTLFVDPFNGWEDGPAKPPEDLLKWRVSLADLRKKVEEVDPEEQLVGLLAPYWADGQRHEMALYTAGYLASLGWTEEAVVDLVTQLTDQTGGDLDNLVECVTDTFEKMYKNENIRGFEGLSQMLPSSVLKKFTDAASSQTFSATLQVVDRIRLGKGQQFQKVRTSAMTIIAHFKENGRLVQDTNNVYWLDNESKALLVLGGKNWNKFMHGNFGLNPLDSFGKQVLESVKLFAQEEAQPITVHKRSFWSGSELYINLGGPEVYVITGDPKTRRIALNGDNNMLFLNSEDPLKLPNLWESEVTAISVWSFLVDDLSFSTGENVNATPLQQRELLKAWIVGTFFAQAMPTRPILTLLAPAGAGKTTTARRILRLLEGPGEDVLGVVQDKPDSIRSSLANHKILVLDNLEKTKASWLTDVLNRVSTGSHIEIRTLYKTNEPTKIVPDCYVIITATEMPFSEETVYTRMLPIELAPLTSPRPEYQIQVQLMERFHGLWKGLLDDLEETVRQLNANKSVEAPNESRLADFTVFCARIQGSSYLLGKELMDGLSSMISRQRKVLQEASPFIQVLEVWLRTSPESASNWKNMSELYQAVKFVADKNKMEWRWTSSQGLSRHIAMLEPQLIRHFGMSTRNVRKNGTEIREYKFTKIMAEA